MIQNKVKLCMIGLTIFLLAMLIACSNTDSVSGDQSTDDDVPVDGDGNVDGDIQNEGELLAVAVGEFGKIWEYDGKEWIMAVSPLSDSIEDIANTEISSVVILDETRAIAVGKKGTILERKEGIWQKINSPTTASLHSIDAVSSDFIVAVGDNGVIIEYNGTQWKLVSTPSLPAFGDCPGVTLDDYLLVDVDMYSTTYGFAVGGFHTTGLCGVVLVRGESGWTIERAGIDNFFSAVGIAQSNYAVFGSYSDYIENSKIGLSEMIDSDLTAVTGLPWRRHVTGIDFYDEQHGLAVTDGGGTPESSGGALVLSYDGSNWTSMGSTLDLTGRVIGLDEVCYVDATTAFAVGNAAEGLTHAGLIEYDGSDWKAIDLPGDFEDWMLRDIACRRR